MVHPSWILFKMTFSCNLVMFYILYIPTLIVYSCANLRCSIITVALNFHVVNNCGKEIISAIIRRDLEDFLTFFVGI